MTAYQYELVSRYLTLAQAAAVDAIGSKAGKTATAAQIHELAQVDITCAALVNDLAYASKVHKEEE